MKTDISDKLNWFTIEKAVPVWVKIISNSEIIQTLEGPIRALKGDYLCKGIDNEQWAIKKEELERCYKPTGKTDGEWLEYKPDSSDCHLWAAELMQEAEIDTKFGKLMGNKGDFVLKETEKDSEIPLRFWIVNREIFMKTYEKF